MPWFPRRPLPDDVRTLALAALEYGLEVCLEDDGEALKLWVSHPDLRIYQSMSAQGQLDKFVNKWVRGQSPEHEPGTSGEPSV